MFKKVVLSLTLGMGSLHAVDVSTEAELDTALRGNEATINLTADITLSAQLFPVNSSLVFVPVAQTTTITGNGFTLNGAALSRGFFIRGGTVNASNLTLSNMSHVAGAGGTASRPGGGGAALGGGLFISDGTTVTLTNVTFQSSSATGGSGGTSVGGGGGGGGGGFLGDGGGESGGGGGGFFGNGGVGSGFAGGGGGGFDGDGGDGPGGAGEIGGAGTRSGGGAGGDFITPAGGDGGSGGGGSGGGGGGDGGDGGSLGADGVAGGGGGAGGTGSGVASGSGGGGGGRGDLPFSGGNGGDGGDGAGGGGAGLQFGFAGAGGIFGGSGAGGIGNGGFAGGGGGETQNLSVGSGGFGGGGPASTFFPGLGGFGGGNAATDGGGGGAAFGGSVFIQRGGALTLAGDIDFVNSSVTGGAGAGSAEDGTAAGVDIFMMSGSDLTFDITSDVLLQNPIAGNQGVETPGAAVPTTGGGLTKRGTSLLSLTGSNTYTGTTTVEAGEMTIDGSVVSNVVIDPGATLTGNFSVNIDDSGANGGDLTNNGTLSPGVGGVGSISMEGEYTQGANAELIIDITPTGNVNDIIMGAAQATLAGTMRVIVNPGNYISGTTYLVIDAPTNGTEFDTVIETGGFGNIISLEVDYSSVIITILSTSLFEAQSIDAGPASDVVNCIRSADIVPNSEFAQKVEALGTLSDSAVNQALVSLSAVRYGALEWINARNNSYVADILSQHLFELCCSPRDCCSCDCNGNVWVSVYGNIIDNQKSLDFLRKYKSDSVGAVAGIDSCCGDAFYYGAAVGYTHSHLIWKGEGGTGDLNSYYGALYGSWVCNWFSADLSVLGGGTDNDLKREIAFAMVNETAKGDFWNYFVTAHLGLRTDLCWCENVFQPFAVADYHYYTHGNFKEKGAESLNLKVLSKDQHMMRGEAGLVWYYDYDCGCYCIAPYLGASWVGEFPLHKSRQPASFTGQTCVIDAESYDSSVQLGSPQAGIKWTHCSGASFLLEYKGLFNNSTRINQVEGRFEWVF